MNHRAWWFPENADDPKRSSGTLLSYRWVQTFLFELPPLKHSELQATLRYKVQAMLPVNTEDFVFHTRLLHHGRKTFGVAFLASSTAKDALPVRARNLRVGVPLILPRPMASETLLFISTPDGLASYYYEGQLLKTSFAPIDADDRGLRAQILAKCPGAQITGFAPDPEYRLPSDLQDKEAPEEVRAKLLEALPLWDPPPPRRLPQILAACLIVTGVALCAFSLWRAWSVREERNEVWKAWLKKQEAAKIESGHQEQTARLLKAMGAPVPELFVHLARVWGSRTHIINLDWMQGKLTLTASSSSALTSLRALTSDPWFRNLRVDDIRTQKDGSEVFTVEGNLAIDQ